MSHQRLHVRFLRCLLAQRFLCTAESAWLASGTRGGAGIGVATAGTVVKAITTATMAAASANIKIHNVNAQELRPTRAGRGWPSPAR